MIYSFTQDLEASRNSYNSFNEVYKNKDNLTRKVNDSGAQIGDGYSLGDYQVEEEEADNDDYTNKGGDRKTKRAIKKTGEISDKGDEEKEENEGFTTGNIIEGAGLGLDIAKGFSTTAGSEKESWAQAGKWGIQGAKIGMQIGGPLGAAAGGVLGAGAGVVDAFGDITKRNTAERNTVNAQNDAMFTKRELEGSIQADEKRVKQLTQLRKNQLNYINLDY